MKITYIGHSTFLINESKINILTDPFFTQSFSVLKRKILPSMLPEALPKIDIVLISHTHPDHCDYDALEKISKTAKIIMPKGTSSKARSMNPDVIELDYWASTNVGDIVITTVPAKHQGKCAGYIIRASKAIYFAGDTFFTNDMEKIGRKYKLDIAFLPVGGNVFFGMKMLMNPKDAALAVEKLNAKSVIPMHFGTIGRIPFIFSMNGTPEEFKNCIPDEKTRKSVNVLSVGESMMIK